MRLPFEKWEGLGNDFIVVRAPGLALDDAAVRRLCDRRFGVGADGVLLVDTSGSTPRMVVRNADGSRPEMCGNGLRCVASHLAALAADGVLVVATDAGLKACEIVAAGPDGFDVAVDMGAAVRGEDLVATFAGRAHRFLTIDMGNPHAITFEAYDDGAVDTLGPAVATLPPGGTNVEFCRVLSASPVARVAVTVWERGVGRTLACGTGACAVAAAACDTGRARFGEPVVVTLPGGDLELTVAAGTRAVRMRGPARRVFAGEVVLA
jgi:diaminopimelate epimerase